MKKKKFKEKLTNVFELPPEVTTGAIRVIVMNNTDLFLENHKGIKEYTMSRVRIRTEHCDIVVCGKDLVLKNMGQENIVLTGEINAIEYEM